MMQPLLANPALKPVPADIELMAGLFQELLAIRYSSPLFRWRRPGDPGRRVASTTPARTSCPA
jgi:pullulanase